VWDLRVSSREVSPWNQQFIHILRTSLSFLSCLLLLLQRGTKTDANLVECLRLLLPPKELICFKISTDSTLNWLCTFLGLPTFIYFASKLHYPYTLWFEGRQLVQRKTFEHRLNIFRDLVEHKIIVYVSHQSKVIQQFGATDLKSEGPDTLSWLSGIYTPRSLEWDGFLLVSFQLPIRI